MKLLYITANPKEEHQSSSKTVGRRVVNAIKAKIPDIQVEELDLYKDHIPHLKGCYFQGRSAVVNEQAKSQLTPEEQKEIDTINKLCDQFRDADVYVLAAPMWNMSFPPVVKEYIDCIVQSGKTVEFKDNKPHVMLGNKRRVFIYVQSSGGSLPWIVKPVLNKGMKYVEDIMKFLGIDIFEEILVDGTGTTEEERQSAILKATKKIDSFVDKLFD